MVVYISGAISNRSLEDAQEHFSFAEDILSLKGYDVVNPIVLNHNHDKTWLSYMKEDIVALMACDAIYMLKGLGRFSRRTIRVLYRYWFRL